MSFLVVRLISGWSGWLKIVCCEKLGSTPQYQNFAIEYLGLMKSAAMEKNSAGWHQPVKYCSRSFGFKKPRPILLSTSRKPLFFLSTNYITQLVNVKGQHRPLHFSRSTAGCTFHHAPIFWPPRGEWPKNLHEN